MIPELLDFGSNLVISSEEGEVIKYKLFALSCHLGDNMQEGHYVSYAATSLSDKWFKFEDEIVTEIDIAHELQSEIIQKHSYLLFYQRLAATH